MHGKSNGVTNPIYIDNNISLLALHLLKRAYSTIVHSGHLRMTTNTQWYHPHPTPPKKQKKTTEFSVFSTV